MIESKTENISDRLRYALQERNMKQVELSEKCGIPRPMINNYLSGRYEPKYKNLAVIAKALNVSEIWLAGYDVPMDRVIDKKNDDLVKIVARLRRDNEYLAICVAEYEMSAAQLRSLADLIAAFDKK